VILGWTQRGTVTSSASAGAWMRCSRLLAKASCVLLVWRSLVGSHEDHSVAVSHHDATLDKTKIKRHVYRRNFHLSMRILTIRYFVVDRSTAWPRALARAELDIPRAPYIWRAIGLVSA
jgi:hypothetical protein